VQQPETPLTTPVLAGDNGDKMTPQEVVVQEEGNDGRYYFAASRYAFVLRQRRHVTADGSMVPDDP